MSRSVAAIPSSVFSADMGFNLRSSSRSAVRSVSASNTASIAFVSVPSTYERAYVYKFRERDYK
jgi:hypothetical protein